jgi:hypothetical protein
VTHVRQGSLRARSQGDQGRIICLREYELALNEIQRRLLVQHFSVRGLTNRYRDGIGEVLAGVLSIESSSRCGPGELLTSIDSVNICRRPLCHRSRLSVWRVTTVVNSGHRIMVF